MSRYNSSSSYGQRIEKFSRDDYRISWVVDFYYAGSRLRFPRRFSRDTDEQGARRFSKRWKLDFNFDEVKR